MCLAIMEYGKSLENELVGCKKFNWQSETDEGCCAERCGNWYKHEATKDIIALLHTML
jgi:hypothetical protein